MINLEREIFDGEGNAKEKLLRFYGKDISYKRAAAYIAGIKLHINTMKRLKKNLESFEEYKEVNFNSDKSQTIKQDIYLNPEEAVSPTKIMQKMGFDPLLWEVISCKVIDGSWDVTMKLVDSQLIHGHVIKKSTPLTNSNKKYSITLTVKPIAGNLQFPQVLAAFKELEPIKSIEYNYSSINKSYLFELPIMDFHLGKLAWSGETGNDYDLKLAEKLWYQTIIDLINKVSIFGLDKIEKILFPIGQDFFHFDTPRTTTTSGTPLDSDTRWEKMFKKGIELLVWAVEELRKIAPVEILWVPGNHDQMLSYAATVGLAQRYSETKSVDVDLSATPRKYRLFGKNLIGYSHGEKEGKRLEGLMQVEVPELWGKSLFREFHMGHLHTQLSETTNGIIFRRISTITSLDSWHVENGFVGATRQAQAFLWDKEFGLQVILNTNIIDD